MNWTALWAQLKKLDKKIDDMETIELKKVDELPETGAPNTIYLVPKETAEEGNYSDEYIWDADLLEYEKVGDTQIIPEENVVIFQATFSAPKSFTLTGGKKGIDLYNELAAGKIVKVFAAGNGIKIVLDVAYGYSSQSEVYLNGITNWGTVFNFKLGPNDTSNPGYQECRYNIPMYDDLHAGASVISSESQSGQLVYDYRLSPESVASKYLNRAGKIYNAGDIVCNKRKLYKCKENNVTGTWNASKWDEITVQDMINTSVPTDYTKDSAVTALYDNTATYELGDIRMHDKELYECTTAIPVAEEWDPTHWTKTDIFSKMPTPVPAVTDYAKDTSVAPLYDATETYSTGDIRMHDKELYVCNTDISVAEAWDSTHWTKTDVLSEIPEIPKTTKVITLTYTNGDKYTIDGGLKQIDLYNLINDENLNVILIAKNGNNKELYIPQEIYSSDFSIRAYNFYEMSDGNERIHLFMISGNVNDAGNRTYLLKAVINKAPLTTISNSQYKPISSYNVYNLLISLTTIYKSNYTYNTNDIATYTDGKLYKCKEDNVTGSWNASKWDAVTVLDVIDSKIADAITSVLNTSF